MKKYILICNLIITLILFTGCSSTKDLINSAQTGNLSKVQQCIKDKIDLNFVDEKGSFALMLAVEKGHYEIVKALLDAGAKTDMKRKQDGYTPLHMAVKNGNIEMVKLLLGKNAPVELTDNSGNTPLHLSAASGNFDSALLLIEKNAPLNVKNAKDKTPLDLTDSNGNTLLHLFLTNNKQDIAKLLLNNNALLDAKNQEGKTAIDIATENKMCDFLAHAFFKKNDFTNALANAETALKEDTNNIEAYYIAGAACIGSGNKYNEKGELANASSNYQKAIEFLNAAIKKRADYAEAIEAKKQAEEKLSVVQARIKEQEEKKREEEKKLQQSTRTSQTSEGNKLGNSYNPTKQAINQALIKEMYRIGNGWANPW